jgi:hypothetical protein
LNVSRHYDETLHAESLGDYIGTKYARIVRKAIKKFSCDDKEAEYFLKNESFEYENQDKCRTYFILDVLHTEKMKILAYFTLSPKMLEFSESIPKNKTDETIEIFNNNRGITVYLISHFACDKTAASNVPIGELFAICMEKVYQVKSAIAGDYVMTECRESDKEFYENSGFVKLQIDKNDNRIQMIRRL